VNIEVDFHFHRFLMKNVFAVFNFRAFIGDSPGFLLVTAKEDRLKFELRTIKPRYKYKTLLSPRNKRSETNELLKGFFDSQQTAQTVEKRRDLG
jgi:hypothetical protein